MPTSHNNALQRTAKAIDALNPADQIDRMMLRNYADALGAALKGSEVPVKSMYWGSQKALLKVGDQKLYGALVACRGNFTFITAVMFLMTYSTASLAWKSAPNFHSPAFGFAAAASVACAGVMGVAGKKAYTFHSTLRDLKKHTKILDGMNAESSVYMQNLEETRNLYEKATDKLKQPAAPATSPYQFRNRLEGPAPR